MKENILGCGLMLQASSLFSHLNTAVLENRASVNKGKLSARSSLHISPEATGSFQRGMPSEGISTKCGSTQQHHHYENNPVRRVKSWENYGFSRLQKPSFTVL